jgi:hypothetical protein
MKWFPITLLLSAFVTSCSSDLYKIPEKPPAGVPASAVAMGSIDGLHWTVCEKLSVTDFFCDVYRGTDGKKMHRSWYRLCLSQSALQKESGGNSYSDDTFQLEVTAVSYRKSQYFNGFSGIEMDDGWNQKESGLDKDCFSILPDKQ